MSQFREALREELMRAQQTRAALVREKLLFTVSALGFGTVSHGWINSPALLYLVPLVTTVFDLYIAGEDFGVKRAGAFLGAASRALSEDEVAWESFVATHRDPFSQLANPMASILALFGAAAVLWPSDAQTKTYWIWILASALVITIIWTASYKKNVVIRRVIQDKPVIYGATHTLSRAATRDASNTSSDQRRGSIEG